jgi:RimJ/RimL family protein N-acetyltransferase
VTPAIETTRLLLLPLQPEDAAEMAAVLADPALYTFIGGSPPAVDELDARYRGWLLGAPRASEAWHNWVIRLLDGGAAVGHLQATLIGSPDAIADIAWVVGTPWQRRGYATEAAMALVDWLESSGVGTITAHVHPENTGSRRVAARAGFEATDEVVDGEVIWRRERHTSGDA